MNTSNPRISNHRGRKSQKKKEYGNSISRSLAIHEAGHAVAHWYTGSFFHRVYVRTANELKAGPYIVPGLKIKLL
jgi:hypothetical protein